MLTAEFTAEQIEQIEKLRTDHKFREEFFVGLRPQLKQLISLRMDPRMRKRIDESDVVQEAFVKYMNSVEKFLVSPVKSPETWTRHLVRNVLAKFRRKHMGTQCRDIRRETFLESPVDLCQLATTFSSVGAPIASLELREVLLEVFSSMPELDREILALIHIEGKTLDELTAELGIKFETARKRYRRALNRLSESVDMSLLEDFRK